MLDVVYGLIQGTNTLAKLEDNINLRKVMSHDYIKDVTMGAWKRRWEIDPKQPF